MPDTLKQKQTRTPKQYEAIEKGALALPIEDRIMLKKKLIESINSEFKDRQVTFEQIAGLVNGKE